MNEIIINLVSSELNLNKKNVKTVLDLLADGSTVPFIARYRKEMTGSLDEETIREIEKYYTYQNNLLKRKEEVVRLIEEKGLLTEELRKEIENAEKLQNVEDLYLPFKEKKKTKATLAREKGLEGFAHYLLTTIESEEKILLKAGEYTSDVFPTVSDILVNSSYIISEDISDVAKYRDFTRKFMYKNGDVITKIKKNGETLDEQKKYEMYYNFQQPVNKIQSYRILAINRAEKEKIINVKIEVEKNEIIERICRDYFNNQVRFIKGLITDCVKDSYKRLILPAVEREIRASLKEKADLSAIEMFGINLDKLIMQPPLKNKWVLGVDPAFRTGCKLAVIDQTGQMKEISVIYPTAPKHDIKGASVKILKIIEEYPIEQIVIGNGTASRETEKFLKDLKKENGFNIPINIVSEAGASVYSASKLAIEEYPDLKVEERSAISIARRIQDPMAELVKIDPKSIGVGQYQHDVNQKELKDSLEFTMMKNINMVGVDLNTASAELLRYVSGLDKTIAKNIVNYRNTEGKFISRKELLKVKRLGDKAYEQSAGFLKILNGKNYLDQTFIHPENYELVNKMFNLLELKLEDFNREEFQEIINDTNCDALQNDLEISNVLFDDIINGLLSAEIDIRKELEVATFDQTVSTIEELQQGMILEGQVRNIVEFGAFVDIGLKNDGLVHISELSNKFVKNVLDVLKIGDIMKFKVKSIDLEKNKVQLSLKDL